uniref:AlNc14C11G1392 protein n=1 Tax=Albugo laibachii Nc14 TaxID=890382 RepID=F0W313_9STRA|nr:AlNc14C11G1392 [Albugo laibachii Nc14]|eukprot:CCA15450.1 AlNc14C11G1392 [Albugo laibachii Nc14]
MLTRQLVCVVTISKLTINPVNHNITCGHTTKQTHLKSQVYVDHKEDWMRSWSSLEALKTWQLSHTATDCLPLAANIFQCLPLLSTIHMTWSGRFVYSNPQHNNHHNRRIRYRINGTPIVNIRRF